MTELSKGLPPKRTRPYLVNCIFQHKFLLNPDGEKAVYYIGRKKKAGSTIYICKNHIIWFDLLSFIFHKLLGFWKRIDKVTTGKQKKIV